MEDSEKNAKDSHLMSLNQCILLKKDYFCKFLVQYVPAGPLKLQYLL